MSSTVSPRPKCFLFAALLALLVGCGQPPSPAPPKVLPNTAATTAPVASVASAKPSGAPGLRKPRVLDYVSLTETLFRGELGGKPIILWLRARPGASPDNYVLEGRFHTAPDGEDILFRGSCDQTGHLTLETDGGGSLTEESGVDFVLFSSGASVLAFHGILRSGGQTALFHVTQALWDPHATSAEIVRRKLQREEDAGTPEHCVVDIDYVEILQGPNSYDLEKMNRLLRPSKTNRWSGDCSPSRKQTGKDVVVANEDGVMSIRSVRRESDSSYTETETRFYTRLIPSGDEVKLEDVIKYTPGGSELFQVMDPAFTKALGGDRKKARAMLKQFYFLTKDPDAPADCLLTPTGVHFVWARRDTSDPSSYPTEEGAVLDFATLRKKKMLNDSGPLSSFLDGK